MSPQGSSGRRAEGREQPRGARPSPVPGTRLLADHPDLQRSTAAAPAIGCGAAPRAARSVCREAGISGEIPDAESERRQLTG
jgi:hypothetical protein